jgi:acyl transferase domain-containing protein/acyl carrier protein
MTAGQPHEELLARARNVIRELKRKLVAAEARSAPEPVAIVGMAGRFPGSGRDLDAFWKMTAEGRNAATEIPRERWDSASFYSQKAPVAGKTNMRRAAFLNDVSGFDAAFFDVAPVEANRMDPQQRIFLETAWDALDDAGFTRASLRGSETAVFVGVHGHSADYGSMQFADPETLDGYAATGTAHDVIAGRLAYWLDLRGPAIVVDTACSSSLVAVHLACRAINAGDCDCAVVGGVNLILSARTSVAMSQLQMLADDGRCKTFDSRADGFGRGEGCGVVVLKRFSHARRDGDRILAVIRGSAINQDGRTNGLTAPSGLAQQRLLRRALEEAKVSPSDIGYFEAHGTGTALGDPIEVEAIAGVLGGEQRRVPCVLGSVKANIGHLEGAAGIAGLIKTVLAIRNGYFPPVANLEELNPLLKLDGSGLSIPARGQDWPRNARRYAGVSSFGWSGTNAHVILEEAPEPAAQEPLGLPVVIAVSAATPEALRDLAMAFALKLEKASAEELAAMSYTSTVRRTHHRYRAAVVGSDGREMADLLRAKVAPSRPSPAINIALSPPNGPSEVALAFEQGAEIDWKTLFPGRGRVASLPQYPFQHRRYWLDQRIGPALDANELVEDLRALSPRDRFERLVARIGRETKSLFGLPPEEPFDENRGLAEMGMNSLMAVRLVNKLKIAFGVRLSATVALNYPSVTSLAQYLDEKLFGKTVIPPAVGQPQGAEDLVAVAAIGEADMGAALEAELAAIRKLGVG